jgi:hypothetical protein
MTIGPGVRFAPGPIRVSTRFQAGAESDGRPDGARGQAFVWRARYPAGA